MKLHEDMQRVVSRQRLGFIATVCPDGTANLSPKGTTAVWDDEHLVFLHLHSPGTVANLATNPSMEINVVDPIARKGYRFKGQARVVADGELFDRILDFYAERGIDPARVQAAVLMRVQTAAPLVSPVYDTGASEPEVTARWRAHHLDLHPRSCLMAQREPHAFAHTGDWSATIWPDHEGGTRLADLHRIPGATLADGMPARLVERCDELARPDMRRQPWGGGAQLAGSAPSGGAGSGHGDRSAVDLRRVTGTPDGLIFANGVARQPLVTGGEACSRARVQPD